MVHWGVRRAVLTTWTKTFSCPDGVGEDVVDMLESAISRRGVRLFTLSQLAKMSFHEVFLPGACCDVNCDIFRKEKYMISIYGTLLEFVFLNIIPKRHVSKKFLVLTVIRTLPVSWPFVVWVIIFTPCNFSGHGSTYKQWLVYMKETYLCSNCSVT